MEHKNKEVRLLRLPTQPLAPLLHVLLELLDRILERRPRVVHLVDDQDILPDQVRHLEGTQVEPLRPRDDCAGLLYWTVFAEVLVQRETDALHGYV